jgi:hypothetical protein
MNDSEHLNKRERAERGLEDLREMLVEMMADGGKKHPGIDAEIDAAHALEGLDRAEDALMKWRSRDINGNWRNEPRLLTRDELVHRSRALADDCEETISALREYNEHSASAHVSAARDAIKFAVAHPHVELQQSVAGMEMILDALERANGEIDNAEDEDVLQPLLTDARELYDDVESTFNRSGLAGSMDDSRWKEE